MHATDPYATAFLDWLACAAGGFGEPAARAAAATGDDVLLLGTAGHVLDYDDTYAPGLSHLSAASAPAALVTAAKMGVTVGDALSAYADGFEAMGALARASHPALYDGGWHPTAVCGVVGAAVAAARLLGAERDDAAAVALLRAGGLRAAFGSDGKSLQVGMAASSGVAAARLAAAGARVSLARAAHGPGGFERAFGARYAEPGEADGQRAIDQNWIKAWPCCLQTHGPIEAAAHARADGVDPGTPIEVAVHPVSLQAAAEGPRPADGLQAKFSIPYLVAYTLASDTPTVESFDNVRTDVIAAAEHVTVITDLALGESEAVLSAGEAEYRVTAALGSPQRPMSAEALRAKVADLAGDALTDALDQPDRPASDLLGELLSFKAPGRGAGGGRSRLPASGF